MRFNPTARVIQHSISPEGVELLTFVTRHPRMIHADFMTHRVFGRNGRSSRAVPVTRLLAEPIGEPMIYGANQKGMTASGELTGWRYLLARSTWLGLAGITKLAVRLMTVAGLHKQWANRPLEWFGYIDVVVTATCYANFFHLRIDGAAQPEIQALAQAMQDAKATSTPMAIGQNEWHVPFIERRRGADGVLRYYDVDGTELAADVAMKVSVARCARTTFATFDGNGDVPAEIARHDRLVVEQPVHASPAEHQATPDRKYWGGNWMNPRLHGNLTGWMQYRKMLPNEWVPG